jgi:hypothetical protein
MLLPVCKPHWNIYQSGCDHEMLSMPYYDVKEGCAVHTFFLPQALKGP